MARHGAAGAAPAGADLVLLMVYRAFSPRRAWVYDVLISSPATPANLVGGFDLSRYEDIGDGSTAINPTSLDPEDSPTYSANKGPFTVAPPTMVANSALLSVGLHQRQTFRWVGRRGRELVIPASGIEFAVGLRSVSHGGTPSTAVTIHWDE